jgi:hypothetical protein
MSHLDRNSSHVLVGHRRILGLAAVMTEHPKDIRERWAKAFEELCRDYRKDLWRRQQEAARAASLTEDFPLSQSHKADQWKDEQ